MIGRQALPAGGGAGGEARAELNAQGQAETFNRGLVEMTRLVVVLAAVGLVPVVAYNRAFVRIWLAPKFPYAGDAVTVLAAVNAVLLKRLRLSPGDPT